MKYLKHSVSETQKTEGWWPGTGGQGAGELVPLGERVSLLQEENNPRDLLYNSVNPLNTTELHLKTGKTVNLTSL